jgi:D-arabinose 1-dehydrogenase-like Zn-dependent alcohol dehydrogenase
MRSAQMTDYGTPLEMRNAETPKPRGAEVLVRVTHCGVCHSDIHLQDGHFGLGGDKKLDIRSGRQLPFTPGHEIEGVVEAVGPEATGAKPGDKRLVWPWIGCGECAVCQRGDEPLCAKPRNLGVQVDGGYSDHVMVPHARYLIEYDGVPEGLAATYMCSGLTAFGALKKLGAVSKDDAILIVGAGGVGSMGIQFAKVLFDSPVLVADTSPAAREAAEKAGADATYDPKDPGAVKKLIADTKGGVYGAVDFVGADASLSFAVAALRKGGRAIVVGLFGGKFEIPIPMFPFREISVGGSVVARLDQTHEMMKLVRAGKVKPIPIQKRPLDQASQTLDDLRAGRIVGRVVLEC